MFNAASSTDVNKIEGSLDHPLKVKIKIIWNFHMKYSRRITVFFVLFTGSNGIISYKEQR
jgi:hypothetical protein